MQKMTVTSVAIATTKTLFGMCDCMVDSDISTGDFSLIHRILHVGGFMHVRSHISRGMDSYN